MGEPFFIALFLDENGEHTGHAVSLDPESLGNAPSAPAKEKENVTPVGDATTFREVFDAYASVISTYQNFLKFTIALAPMLFQGVAERKIGNFVKDNGTQRDDLSNNGRRVYEVNADAWRELTVHHEDIESALIGARHLPEVMLIGLVSSYDSFLGKLLKVIFTRHESMILTSEKAIKFSELSEFKSIEDARRALIEREIESVLRESHQDHFKWMEGKFQIPLKKDLPVFPKFVELCERRNLLTHTGGIVSAKYLVNCKAHNVDLKGVELGAKLTVGPNYYSAAVNVVCEIGIKLCYVLWRKFAKEEREEADKRLNQFCYDLILRRNYSTAEAILSFSTKVLSQKGNDRCRRMMLINQANAIRLQDRPAEAIKLLESEDWSAVSDEFKISVAAVRGDIDGVVELLKKIGKSGHPDAEDYRSWPVFRGIRSNPKFGEAFQSVFGEPLLRPRRTEVNLAAAEEETPSLQTSAEETLH